MEKKEFKLGFGESISEISVAMAIRHISVMLRSGISLDNTIKIMTEQSEDPLLRKVFGVIHESIQKGVSLAESMRKFPKVFSPIVVSIIEVGEQGGGLDQNLLFLADYLKKKNDLQKKINGALLYPMIVFFLTAVEMSGVIFFILPKMEKLFLTFKNIPAYVILIMNITTFVRTNWYWLLLGVILLGILIAIYVKTKHGKRTVSVISLHFPVIKNVVRLNILTSIARTIGILMSNGIPLVRAIKITADTTSNVIYNEMMKKIATEVEGGKSFAACLRDYKKYFPATFIQLVELGESSGSLEENLRYLHGFYSEELQELTNNMAALIEPILLIFIGLMIGLLAVIIVGPIYSLTSAIND